MRTPTTLSLPTIPMPTMSTMPRTMHRRSDVALAPTMTTTITITTMLLQHASHRGLAAEREAAKDDHTDGTLLAEYAEPLESRPHTRGVTHVACL
mmetsp:Transcript_17204/g.48861  ORF Transcript_17204/g.48861 Transcript_17204/m.48861 type:complete len:95 (+) Transcript_17204:649-933(+)